MQDLTLTPPASLSAWLRLYLLYRVSFPRAERKPFSIIVNAWRRGKTDIFCIFHRGHFAGFATTMNGEDLIMLDYFAIEKCCRGQGIGTAALQQLLASYPGKGIFLEIESAYTPGPHQEKRRKRKAFYLRCGLQPLNVMANVFGVPMELLGINCQLDFETYHNFYRTNYRVEALKFITPMAYPNANTDV